MGMESRDAVWYPADADADGNCDGHLPPPMTRFASLLFAPLGWNRPARAGAAARGAAAIADRRDRMPAVRESMVAMPAVFIAAGTCRRSSRRNPKSTRRRAPPRDGQAGKNKGSKKSFVSRTTATVPLLHVHVRVLAMTVDREAPRHTAAQKILEDRSY